MKNFHNISLEKICNHKLVYDVVPTRGMYGVDNVCFLREDYKLKEREVLNGISFHFSFGEYDNVQCEMQHIEVGVKASSLHIIGFAYWGDTNEYFKVVFEDGSEEYVKIPFMDWSHKASIELAERVWYGDGISTIKTVISSGELILLRHLHHSVGKIESSKIIKEIIFPDNMFLHVLSVTLEEENED